MGRIEDIEVPPATGQLTKADGTVVIAKSLKDLMFL